MRPARTIVGSSLGLRDVLARSDRVARTNVTVLVEGESGTGKELLARYVHDASARADGPFVALNCAAIPRDLLEAELFGYERGAFSGAHATKLGAFERAHGGTLFLDEIGDMALEHQGRVLRAIQEGEIQRLGCSPAPRKVDVRIVAATHRNLRAQIDDGAFRDDLFFRLAGYELRLPPLRERGWDVVAIANDLLKREFPTKCLTRSAQALLLEHSWPGNIRELENFVRTVAIDTRRARIDDDALLEQPAFAGVKQAREQTARTACPLDARLAALHAFLARHGRITAAEARSLFHLQKARAYRLLAAWERSGEIAREGNGRGSFYVATDAQRIPRDELLARRQNTNRECTP